MISEACHNQKILELQAENTLLSVRVEELSTQLQWFKAQLFGEKSERRIPEPPAEQLCLGEQFQQQVENYPFF